MGDFFDELGFKANPKTLERYKKVTGKSGLRRKLKTNTRQRLRKEYKSLKTQLNPTDPITGMPVKVLDSQARDQVRNEYAPAVKEIGQQIAGFQQRKAEIPQWYDQYRQHLTTLATGQANAAAQLATDLTNASASAQTTDQGQQAQLANAAQGNQFATEALQAGQDASKGRAALTQAAAGGINERGAIRSGVTQGFATNSHLDQQRQQGINEGQLRGAGQTQADLKKEIARAFDGGKTKIRDAISKAKQDELDAQLKQEVLNLNKSKAQIDAEDKAADNARDTAKFEWDKEDDISDNTRDQQRVDKEAKPKSKYTQSKRVAYRDKAAGVLSNATEVIAESRVTTKPDKNGRRSKYAGQKIRVLKVNVGSIEKPNWKKYALTKENESEILRRVKANGLTEPTLAYAVMQQLIYKGVGQKTWDQIRALGINPAGIGLKKQRAVVDPKKNPKAKGP